MRYKILSLMLLVLLLVSSYAMIIPGVELLSRPELVKSLSLFNRGDSSPSVEFQVGDTLVVVAEVHGAANAYSLTIEDEECKVLSKTGRVDGARVEVDVPLYPPAFNAGNGYVVFFHAYALNYPLPGATISDVEATGLILSSSETKLKLDADYDHDLRSLYLNANLTSNRDPVAGETVDFHLQLGGERRMTDGWKPIGSAETNGSGIAYLNLAFNVIGGNHSIKAHHKGNANFGESKDIANIEVPYETLSFGVTEVEMNGDEVRVVLRVTDE